MGVPYYDSYLKGGPLLGQAICPPVYHYPIVFEYHARWTLVLPVMAVNFRVLPVIAVLPVLRVSVLRVLSVIVIMSVPVLIVFVLIVC